MSGGRVGLIIDGSTNQTEVDISPYPFHQRKGYAHSFAYGQANETHILNIGQITVNSGVIAAINGFHSANLSGPLVVSSTQPVDRLSFDALLPGASITTGGDLNTLDVLNGINLNSGPGIVVGRDLNLLNVGQDLDLSNGASITVGRFLGLVPQPPKGTATGANFLATNQALVGTGTSTIVPSLSAYIQGNVNIGAGSVILRGQRHPQHLDPRHGTGRRPQHLAHQRLAEHLLGHRQPAPDSRPLHPQYRHHVHQRALGARVNSVVARSGSNIAGFGP